MTAKVLQALDTDTSTRGGGRKQLQVIYILIYFNIFLIFEIYLKNKYITILYSH